MERIEPYVRDHLKNVYGAMSLAVLTAGLGSYVHSMHTFISGGFLSSIAFIALNFMLAYTPHHPKNEAKRGAMFLGLGFTCGLNMGPLLEFAYFYKPALITSALFGTSIVFGCFTLATMLSNQRRWLYLGGFLSSLLSMVLITSLANIFIGSQLIFQTQLYLGLFIMSGFIIYDTAMIIEKRRIGDDDYLWHAVQLFIDFVSVFKHILVILMQKEEGKRRRKK